MNTSKQWIYGILAAVGFVLFIGLCLFLGSCRIGDATIQVAQYCPF